MEVIAPFRMREIASLHPCNVRDGKKPEDMLDEHGGEGQQGKNACRNTQSCEGKVTS